MSKAIKFSDNVYLDSDSVVFKKQTLKNLLNYSEKEQIIGTWMGKTLYRKTISTTETFTASVNLHIPHGVENVDKMWIDVSNSYLFENTNKVSIPIISTGYYDDFEQPINAMVYNKNIILYTKEGGWGSAWTKVVTVRYTKTTD